MSNRQKKTSTNTDPTAMLMNPYYAITLYPGLFGEHPPMVTEDQWVAANTRLIGELGAEAYLRRLLAVLKGDYPRQPDDMPGE